MRLTARRRTVHRRVAHRNPAQISGMKPTGVPGVFMKNGVDLNAAMKTFLAGLRDRVGFDFVVNSGVRSPLAQAQALAQDYNFAVYGAGNALVAELLAHGPRPTMAQMAATIQQQVNSGRFLSRHMRGDALDINIWGITGLPELKSRGTVTQEATGERKTIMDAARSLGAEVLDEGDHIHIEELGGTWLPAPSSFMWLPVIVSGASAAGLLGAMWWYREPLRSAISKRFGSRR